MAVIGADSVVGDAGTERDRALSAAIARDGFAFVAGPAMRAMLARHSSLADRVVTFRRS